MDDYKYDDIIDLPHPVSHRHPPMPRESRAAQFAPFAALRGYDDSLQEEARLTEGKITLDDQQLSALNRRLSRLNARLESGETPTVHITYFVPDERKTGGHYRTVTATLYAIDPVEGHLIMADRQTIPMGDIIVLREDERS